MRASPTVHALWVLFASACLSLPVTAQSDGARSELMLTHKRSDAKNRWAEYLKSNKSWNKTAVALANKHARIIWSLLAREESYRCI